MAGLQTRVSDAIEFWLGNEIHDSTQGRNAYLGDYEARQADFEKPFDDLTNVNARKIVSHYDRLQIWASDYLDYELETDDTATARLGFCSLMQISGARRKQCLLGAKSARHYRLLRVAEPISIDLDGIISDEFFASSGPALPDRSKKIIQRTLAVNNWSLEAQETLQAGMLNGTKNVEDAQELYSDLQTQWAGLFVAQVIVAASFRGNDFSKVPFFEPRSITDQSALQYPLSSC